MRNMKAKMTNNSFTIVAAIIVALSLMLLQVPISGLGRQAQADVAGDAQEQLAAQLQVEIPLEFDHAYIEYDDQKISLPATKVELPSGADFEFKVFADNGYQVESVKATINGEEVELKLDKEKGTYKLTDSEVALTTLLAVQAITAPSVEGVEVATTQNEPAAANAAAPEASAPAGDDADDESAGMMLRTSSLTAAPEDTSSESGETAIDANNATVTFAVYASEADRSARTNPLSDDYEIKMSQKLFGAVSYDFFLGEGPTTGRLTYTYTMPSNIVTADKAPATLYDDGGNVAGTWQITNNVVYFNYNEKWALSHPDSGGHFNFDFTLDQSQSEMGEDTVIVFPGSSKTITVKVKEGAIEGKKSAYFMGNGKVTYKVALTAETDFDSFVFSDTLQKNLHYDESSFKFDNKKFDVTVVENEDGSHTATAAERSIKKGSHTIKYDVYIDQDAYDALYNYAYMSDVSNTASWTYANEGDDPKTGSSTVKLSFSRGLLSKSEGVLENGGMVDWTININNSSKMKSSVAGYTVTDTLNKGLAYDTTYTVYKTDMNTVFETGTIPEGAKSFSYTFPEDAPADHYIIVYKTKILDTSVAGEYWNSVRIDNRDHVKLGSSVKKVKYNPDPQPGEDDNPNIEFIKEVADESNASTTGVVTWHTKISSQDDLSDSDIAALNMEYSDTLDYEGNYTIAANGESKVFKIWFVGEPRVLINRTELEKDVDYVFEASDPISPSQYGYTEYNKGYGGDDVPTAFCIRLLGSSAKLQAAVQGQNPTIDIYYDTQCDGTHQTYHNVGSLDFTTEGWSQHYGDVEAVYTIQGLTQVSKSGNTSWDEDEQAYVTQWEAVANRDDDGNCTSELASPLVSFVDTLPDGLTVLRDSIEFRVVRPSNTGSPDIDMEVPYEFSQYGNEVTFEADLSKVTVPDGAAPLYDSATGTCHAWVQLRFKTKVDPEAVVHDGTEQTLINTVVFKSGNVPIGTARAATSYSDPIIMKEGSQEGGEPVAHYTIEVNPKGHTLMGDSNVATIDLKDLLDYRSTVVLGSIKVVNSKTNEDLTDECVVTLNSNETDEAGNPTSSFTISVPDSTPLRVTYDVTLAGASGEELEITNEASLSGVVSKSASTTQQFKVYHADASVYGSNTSITITKSDSNNVVDSSARLAGAVFDLYAVDMDKLPDSATYTDEQLAEASTLVGSATTNTAGEATLVESKTSALQYDKLYFFKESTAPVGYAIDDPSPHFIMIEGSHFEEQSAKAAAHGITPTKNTTFNATDTKKTSELLKAKKYFQNGRMKAGQFSFELRDGNGNLIETAKNAADGTVSFSDIEYDAAGVYDYTISEVAGSATAVTYDTKVVHVTVTVTNDGAGSYKAEVAYEGGGTEAVFTNVYDPKATVSFFAQKTLTGRTLSAKEFSFELMEDGKVIQTKDNAGDGRAMFDEITYTIKDVGKHSYAIREVAGTKAGVTYDTHLRDFTVTVTDNGDGTLKVSYNGYDPAKGMKFENTYEPSGSVVLQANKLLDGKAPATAGAYSFQLTDGAGTVYATATNAADGSVTFPALTFKAPGTYCYYISEVVPDGAQKLGPNTVANGVAYDTNKVEVTIVAIDNFDGSMRFTTTYEGGSATFNNATVPAANYPLVAKKAITGRTFKQGDEFTFTVSGSEGAPMPAKTQVTINPTSGSETDVNFGDIAFTTADLGKTYTYTISEANAGATANGLKNDPFSHWVKLTVGDAGDGTLSVTPTYPEGATGVTFTNTYTAQGKATVTATKQLTGRALAQDEQEFFFELTGDNLPAALHAAAQPDGTVTFPEISFTQADAGKDFHYTMSEVQGSLGGVTYDTTKYNVTIHVSDNGDGTLGFTYTYTNGDANASPVFKNNYKPEPTSAVVKAHKALVGGTLQGGEFTFRLQGTSQNALATDLTAKNAADGIVTFDAINYEEAGVYEYRMTEIAPPGATKNEDGTFTDSEGVIYDGSEHTVTVAVTDDGLGTLSSVVAYDNNATGISFGNTKLVRTGFSFDKRFFGDVGTFDFTLTATDKDGNPRAGQATDYSTATTIVDDGAQAFTATVQNGAFDNDLSKVAFPEISFTGDGDYYYLVKEDAPSTSTMTADAAQYLAHVVVSGGQVASTTFNLFYDGHDYGPTTDLTFYNNATVKLGFASVSMQGYTDQAQRVSVYPKAKKYLNGSTDQLVGGDFTFQLIDNATGKVLAEATNDEMGNIAFFDENTNPGLAYNEPGTYRYTIREVAGNEAGMIYDSSAVSLIVNVAATSDGLQATTTYNGPGGSEPAFYNVKQGMDLTVQKVSRYGGEGLDNCTYALWMASPNGDVMLKEATSNADGYITFTDVTLLAGQKYYFKEVEAPKGHTVDPYRTAYFSLNPETNTLELVEETAPDGWHSATENIDRDRANANGGN